MLTLLCVVALGSSGPSFWRSQYKKSSSLAVSAPAPVPQAATAPPPAPEVTAVVLKLMVTPPAPVPIACPDDRPKQHVTPTGTRYVVIAAALGYGIKDFQKFIVPLRKVYTGDVVILVHKPTTLASEIRNLCKNLEITLQQIPTGNRLGVKGNRYTGYANVCSKYDWCFASDFRDAFFQDDPFKVLPSGYDLILPEEFKTVTIKNCKYNREWIETCWGTSFLNRIGHNPPICSGTIMGTPAGFCSLKDAMLTEMARTGKMKGCKARDQGHLNYLYFAKKLGVPALLQPRGQGIVNTVGYIPLQDIGQYLNSEGLIVDTDGTVSAVVHQYDRFPTLTRLASDLAKGKKLPSKFSKKAQRG